MTPLTDTDRAEPVTLTLEPALYEVLDRCLPTAFATGSPTGVIKVQPGNRGRPVVVVNQLPDGVDSDMILKSISRRARSGDLPTLSGFNDETPFKGPTRLVFEPRIDADPAVSLDQLTQVLLDEAHTSRAVTAQVHRSLQTQRDSREREHAATTESVQVTLTRSEWHHLVGVLVHEAAHGSAAEEAALNSYADAIAEGIGYPTITWTGQ